MESLPGHLIFYVAVEVSAEGASNEWLEAVDALEYEKLKQEKIAGVLRITIHRGSIPNFV